MLVLGEDRDDVDVVQQLADRIPGLRGIFGGRLRNAAQVEALTANLIAINRRYKTHAGLRITGTGTAMTTPRPARSPARWRGPRRARASTSRRRPRCWRRGATDLDRLMVVARRVRDAGLADAGRPGVVTYSRKVFIPLTRLCRDRCHYCTFVTVPGKRRGAVPESPTRCWRSRVTGAALGCKEALFTLGDRPEDRWPEAQAWLEEAGYDSTLEYVRAMAILVLEETGSAAAPEPRRHELGGDEPAQAGRAVDGDDARDHVASAVRGEGPGAPQVARTRTRRCGCGCWRTPAG